MSEKYFLTQQTANLKQDLRREIESKSSILLLYGPKSIGKSCFINAFIGNYPQTNDCQIIDFTLIKTDSPTSNTNLESAAKSIASMFTNSIEGSLIVIDHFEEASQTERHQIFQSWNTAGVDKKLRLILIVDNRSLQECEALSVQYKTEIQTVELLPLNVNESKAFVKYCLEGLRNKDNFEFPAILKNDLSAANGMPGHLIKFCQTHELELLKDRAPVRSGRGALFIAICLFSGVVSWLIHQGFQSGSLLPPPSPPLTLNDEATDGGVQDNIDTRPSSQITDQEVITDLTTNTNKELADNLIVGEEEVDPKAVSEVSSSDDVDPVMSSPIMNGETDQPVQPVIRDSRWLEQLINESKQWIISASDGRATIQLMSIETSRFDFKNLDKFAAELSEEDLKQLKMLSIKLGSRSVYGLFYGEFDSRRQASDKINTLPENLKASSPFPRSILGVRQDLDD